MSPLYAAQDTWLGTTDGNWATTTNWSVVPVDGDSLLFTGVAPNLTTNDNLSSLTTISGITFDATAGAYTLNGATATLGLTGGISDLSTAADAINLNLALGGTESISVTQGAGLLTMGGTISGSGFGITKTGVGTLTLTGADTYTGPTTISAGTLKLDFNAAGAATTILNPSSGLVLGGVGTFAINGATAGSTQAVTGLTLNAGGSIVSVISNTGSTNLSLGSITRNSGSAIDFTLPASGAITTTTPNASFTGGHQTILGYAVVGATSGIGNAATWAVSGSGATAGAISGLPAASYSTTAALVAASDADVPASATAASGLTVNSLRIAGTAASTLTLSGGLTVATGGILYTNTSGGTITGGSLTSGNGTDLVFINASNNHSLIVASPITGNVGVTFDGIGSVGVGGQLQLSSTAGNTYTGDITIVGGRLQINNANAFGTGTKTMNIIGTSYGGGGEFFDNNVAVPATVTIKLAGLGWAESGGTFGALRARNTISSAIILTDNARIGSSSGGTLAGPISGPFELSFGNNSATNKLILSSTANSWSGGTRIERGLLDVGVNNALPISTIVTFGTTITTGAFTPEGSVAPTLDLNGFSAQVGGLSVQSGDAIATATSGSIVTDTGAAGTLTINNTANVSFSGVITNTTNPLTLVKSGTGTQTLSGINTYTGSTTVSGGKFALGATGSINNTPSITVSSGATYDVSAVSGYTLANAQTLTNNGTVAGNVTVPTGTTIKGTGSFGGTVTMSGGNLSPGNSIGTVNMNGLSMSSGTWLVELGGAASDVVHVTGTAAFTGGGITFSTLTAPTQPFYDILTAGTLTGASNLTINNPSIGRTTFSFDPSPPANTIRIDVISPQLVWNNSPPATGDGATWDIQTNQNWQNGSSPDVYFDGDNVNFTDNNNGRYSVTLNSAVSPGSFAVNNSAGDYTISGAGSINGGGSLVKNGTGALTLGTFNSYSGGTVLNNGTLNFGNAGAIGSGTFTLAGGSFDNTSGSAIALNNNPQIWSGGFTFVGSNTTGDTTHDIDMGTGSVTLNSSAAVTIAGSASTFTIGGIIQNGTGTGFTKSGPGTLVLNGANTYTGATTVTGGTVRVSRSNSLGLVPGGSVTIGSGATLDITVVGGTANALNFSQKQFFIAGNGANGVEGAIVNAVNGVAQQNAFQRVALTADASIGGITRFDIRSVAVGGVNQAVLDLAGHTLTDNNTNFVGLVGVNITDGSIVVSSPPVGVLTSPTLDFETTTNVVNNNSGASVTFNSGTTAFFFNYAGTLSRPLVLNGGSRIGNDTNNTAVVASNITLGGTGTVTATSINNNGTGTLTLNGVISGSQSLTKTVTGTGNSTLVLGGNNTFTGGLIIDGGIVQLNNAGALNSSLPNVVTFGPSTSVAALLRLNGNSVTVGGLVSDPAASQQFVVNTSATPATLTVSNSADDAFEGVLQNGAGAGALSLTKSGSGTLTLGGVSTYTGATTITGGTLTVGDPNNNTGSIASAAINVQSGTLRIGVNNSLAAPPNVTLGSGTNSGVFDLAGHNATVGGLATSGSGTGNIVGNSGSFPSTLTFAGGTSSFGGTIQDVVGGGTSTTALSVTGGTLTLTSVNTHTGGTNINGGTLAVNGSIPATAPVTITSGILSGNGSVGDVTMNGGGIRPGASAADGSIGALAMHSLSVNGGDWRVDLASGNVSDFVSVAGSANFFNASTLTPASNSPPPGTYLLLSAGSPISGTPPTTPTAARATYTLHFGDNVSGPDNITLNVVGSAKSLTWTGNPPGDGTTWDVETTQNWSDNGGATTDEKFFNLDSVAFPNSSHRAITLNQVVQPGSVTFSNDANNPYTLTGSGAIDGPTNVTLSGGGTVTIATNNTYNGTTSVNSGSTLRVGDPNLSGGTSGSLGTGPIAVDGTVIFNRSDSITVADSISGAGTVQMSGAGILVLTSANSYSGGTVFNNGTVQAAADNNLGGSAGPLTFNGGSLEATASFETARGTTINAPGGFFNVDFSFTLTHSGVISGAGVLHSSGPGTLVLGASNTFTGGLSVDNGVVQLGNTGALNSTTPDSVSFPANVPAGSALVLNGNTVTISGLNTDPVNPGNAVVSNSSTTAATLTVNSPATNTFGGVLQDTNLSLTMTGGGTLVLSGSNTFGGRTTINAATIQTAVAGNLVALTGQVQFVNGTLHITGDPNDPTAVIVANNTSNKFTTSGNGGATGTFNIDAGVSFQTGGTNATQTTTTAALQTAGSGTAGSSFIKTGLGTMIIYGQNNQQDTNFQLQQGTVDLRSARGLGGQDTNAVRLDMSSGTTLILDNDPGFSNATPIPGVTGTDFLTGLRSVTNGGTINIVVDCISPNAAATHAFGAMQAAGAFTMNVTSGPNMTSGTPGFFIEPHSAQTGGGFNGAVALSGNGTFNVFDNATSGAAGMLMTIDGPVTGTGFGITKSGNGTLLLTGANSYSGGTTVSAGTLQLANASVNSIPSSPTINVAGAASLDVTGLNNSALVLGSGTIAQSLTGSGTVTGAATVNGGAAAGSGGAPAGSSIGGTTGSPLTVTAGVTLLDQSHSVFTLGAPTGTGNPLTSAINITGGALSVTGTNRVDLSGAAQIGTYELYAFTSGTPTSNQFTLNSSTAGNFSFAFSVIPNREVDLVVTGSNSASWNFNGDGLYSETAKWDPTVLPGGAGSTVTFGNGTTNTVNVPTATVTIDGAYLVGNVAFSNTNGTAYVLGNGGAGTGITLSNSGNGSTISVAAGVTAQQQIQANLTLGENVTFSLAGGTSLLVTGGSISDNGGGRSLTLSGGGTLTIDSASSYGGTTTISAGTLRIGNGGTTGSLGTGNVVDNATLSFNRSNALAFTQVIGGTGGLSQDGSGTTTLSGLNTFTGNVVVNAGTLLAQTAVAQNAGTPEALGNATVAGRTITVNGGATLSLGINNVFGNQTNTAVTAATLDGHLLPSIIVNGGTLNSTRYNQVGNITLNGGTMSQSTTDTGNFEGYQFLGSVTVTGSSPSTISTGNGRANHLGLNTLFDVADVSGDANADLTVSAPLRNASNDYGLVAGSLNKTGVGTMVLSAANIYTGGTTITNGVLTTTATGTLGVGPLNVNGGAGANSIANLGSNQSVTSLSGAVSGGTARVNVAAGMTLTDTQAAASTYAGVISLAAGATANSGGTLTKSGAGALEVQGDPSLGNNSNINVSGGTLRFNVTSGSAFVGTGVLATITNAATLELAGSVSALDPAIIKGRADVLNNSTAAAGLHVTGANQQVGSVDGAGTTQVDAGADLTANHIVQGALVIGGDATHPALVTIDASDVNGNPLAQAGGLALAGSLSPSASFASSSLSSPSLSAASDSSSSAGAASLGGSGGGVNLGGANSAVPEPATLVLLGLGGLICLLPRLRRATNCRG